MKFLVVEDEDIIRDCLVEILEDNFDLSIETAKSGLEAIELIKKGNIGVVLSDYNMPDGTGGEIYAHLQSEGSKIPFILISSEDIAKHPEFKSFYTDHPGNFHALKPFDEEEIIGKVKKSLETTQVDYVEKAESEEPGILELVPVVARNFLKLKSLNKEVYIKISNKKNVKILDQGSPEHKETIQKYIDKGVKALYLRRSDYASIVDELCEVVMRELDELGENSTFEQTENVIFSSYGVLKEQLTKMGVSRTTIELTEKSIEKTMDMFKKAPSIGLFFKQIKEQNDYIYQHTIFTSFLCGHILNQTDWGSRDNIQKLTLATMLHDICIRNPELAKVTSLEDPVLESFTRQEVKSLKSHPQDAVILAKELGGFSTDVETIILQHHERPDGDGWPKGMNATNISPLACVFIIAHDFAQNVLTRELSPKVMREVIAQLTELYDRGNFKKPLHGLIDTVVFDFL